MSARGRAVILVVTGALAVVMGSIVALAGDGIRIWVLLAVLVGSVGAYVLSRGGTRPPAKHSRAGPQVWWVVRVSYVGGLATSGLLVLRPAGALTASDLLFAASFVLYLAYLIREDRPVRPVSPWIGIGAGIFAIGALASSAGAAQVSDSLGILLRFVLVAVMWVWLGVQVIGDWPMLRVCATAWAFGGAMAASGAVLQALVGDVLPGTAITWGRMTGFTQNVNDLGGVCAIALPISVCLVMDTIRNGRRGAPVYVAVGLLNFAGLVLSGSVGGFTAALLGLTVVALTTRWSAGMAIVVAVSSVVAATIVTAFGVGISIVDRFGAVTGSAGDPSATLWTRLDAISAAWQAI